MAHKVIGDKVLVDWTTGDPERDRLTLLAAYRDFIKEMINNLSEPTNSGACQAMFETIEKWGIDTENQIDEVPRIWIKRPQAG